MIIFEGNLSFSPLTSISSLLTPIRRLSLGRHIPFSPSHQERLPPLSQNRTKLKETEVRTGKVLLTLSPNFPALSNEHFQC